MVDDLNIGLFWRVVLVGIWFVPIVVFLLENRIVQRLFLWEWAWLRKLSRPEQVAVLLILIVAVVHGSTKPSQSSFRANAPARTESGAVSEMSLSPGQLAAGFVLAEIRTNETHDLTAPEDAVIHDRWLKRGAAEDVFSLAPENWSFRFGTNVFTKLFVASTGNIGCGASPLGSSPLGFSPLGFSPLETVLGIVPEANWGKIASATPVKSQFWHQLTPSNSLLLTWQNALLARDTNAPVSVQAELFQNGDFTFRYDLYALTNLTENLTGMPVSIGAWNGGFGESFTNLAWLVPTGTLLWKHLPPNATATSDDDGDGLSTADELFLHRTDPECTDKDCDGVPDGEEIGRSLDPLSRDTTYGNLLREWSVHTESGIPFDEKQHLYDDKNRLRSTLYSDGSFTTNAYSCCRLLWSQDRTGRKTLRSAQTGTDHLYYAIEEVSLADLPHDDRYIAYKYQPTGAYRTTQHFMDALGRETNTIVRTCKTPGAATNLTWACRGWRTTESTAYPYGVSDYEVATDSRGIRTTTIRRAYADRETTETIETNVTTTATTYRNGGMSLRETWPDGKWKETLQTFSYSTDGCRIDTTTISASDHGEVTERIVYCDFLGRTIREIAPLSNVTYTYDGASSRILTSADSVSGTIATRLYNDFGEAIGETKNATTNRTDTAYEAASGVLWRATTQTATVGLRSRTSATKERLTGLSDALRSESFTYRDSALALHTYSSFDAESKVLTEVSESATMGLMKTKSKYGIAFETTTPAGTTSRFFDPFGRVFYTEKDGRSVDWNGRNDFGDVIESDTFHAKGDSVFSGFFGYDSFGNRTIATNALGAVTASTYDFAQCLAETEGAVYPVRYAYDTESRRTGLSTTRDGINWDTTTWTYDPATSLCTSKTYADGSTISYTHTPDGKPLRITYSSGHWKENVYDASRQIIGIVSSDGALDAAITRDEFGTVTSESNAVALVKYSLDAQDNATNEVQMVDGVFVSFKREFDVYGRIMKFSRVNGEKITIGYAEDGQIAVVSNENAVTMYIYTGDRYDAGYSLALSNNVHFTRTLTRDDYRRSLIATVTNYVGDVFTDGLAYTYDALNRPISRGADTFAYNERGEVVSLRRGAENVEDAYAYDNIGNLLYSADHSTTNTYVSNYRNQYTSILRDSVSSCEPIYDADGNMTQHGDWTYNFDAGNRLISVSSNDMLVATFAYDAQGRRVKKVTANGTHRYFYDGWLLVYEHIIRPNCTTNEIEYVWGKDISGTRGGAAGIGGLLYLKRDGVVYIPWYDAYGNILGYCDAQGSVVAQYIYDAFGDTISQSEIQADAFSLRYSTKYYDSETDFYYYGYRYYNPQIMRWLTMDPAAENGGLNLYAFCGNNTVSYMDIKGGSGKTLNEIEKTYREMITAARKKGKNIAADNLEYFLSNKGGTKILDWNWLRSDSSVIAGERLNQKRFEKKLKEKSRTLLKGEKIRFFDYFDATETASVFSELYYASGTFTVTSYGDFTLERTGCVVSIEGNVDHCWWDNYDWHDGLSAYVPGFGYVEDADAKRLENNGLAKSFRMEAEWTQKMSGSYAIRKYLWNKTTFIWNKTVAGNTGIRRRNGKSTSTDVGSNPGGGRQ